MFDNLKFKAVTTTGKSTSEPVSITHSFKTKKNELLFRISSEVMEQCNFQYQDKVQILFASDNTVCRIQKSDKPGCVTLSQQSKKSEASPAIIRLSFRPGLPDFLTQESKVARKQFCRVKYLHKDDLIEFKDGCLTFQLDLVDSEEEEL
ncbi:hypothetical protein ACET9E_10005 [Aeromonas caviae]|uniref:hypothetical protein n=1 Tax=Aeromonas caviae TaxID=648 RepID=UPI002B45E07C|nr:hypothetical protein [Aeromonas caviae]